MGSSLVFCLICFYFSGIDFMMFWNVCLFCILALIRIGQMESRASLFVCVFCTSCCEYLLVRLGCHYGYILTPCWHPLLTLSDNIVNHLWLAMHNCFFTISGSRSSLFRWELLTLKLYIIFLIPFIFENSYYIFYICSIY